MDFELSADQRALQDAAADLLGQLATSERVRRADGFDADLWREMVAQGWPALAVAEDAGGIGLGLVETAVLAEQIGRHVAPAPYVSTAMALHAVVAGGASEYAERLLSGAIGAVAWGGVPVPDLPIADVLVVVGSQDVTAYDVSSARPDVQPAMDLTRRVASADCLPGNGISLGEAALAEEMLDRAATVYAAELLGIGGRMLELAVDYAKVREQFGKPIGSFQAVKHRCADMHVDVEGMRSSAYYAAWAVQAIGGLEGSLAASTAKSWCGDAAIRVVSSALQVHGGIGFTWEHDLHLYLKRAQLTARLFGDAGFHRERIVGLLRRRVAGGDSLF